MAAPPKIENPTNFLNVVTLMKDVKEVNPIGMPTPVVRPFSQVGYTFQENSKK